MRRRGGLLKRIASICLPILLITIGNALAWAELPSIQEVLAIQNENRAKLSRLHLQLSLTYETTEESCRLAQARADEREETLRLVAAKVANGEDISLTFAGRPVNAEEKAHLLNHLIGAEARREIKNLRAQAKPYRIVKLIEFFKDGEDYQYRTPAAWNMDDAQLAAWSFSSEPLDKSSLVNQYAHTMIYSRTSATKPAGRRWSGIEHDTAYLSDKHLTDSLAVNLPPMTNVAQPRWDYRHPHDGFFLAPDSKCRVVREEEIDGRTCVVVDAETPLDAGSSSVFIYRAWLDLARGGVPLKLYQSYPSESSTADYFDHQQPSGITRTEEVREVVPGVYYPAKTVTEHFEFDPAAAQGPEAEWITLPDGKREPPVVAIRRYTWDCSVVEVPPPLPSDFFVLAFPDDQKIYDLDAGKLIGALPRKPRVQVGQQAPPLAIGHWLDGKQRTLADLRGKVVVLDFWGLWCGSCRTSVPDLQQIQDESPDGVIFISIHTAERDPQQLAARIEDFAKQTGWTWVAAIDSGTMSENSVTACEYGIEAYPTTVIIGPDGKILYVDPEFIGPACSEEDPQLTAEFQQKAAQVYQKWFTVAGEEWPLPDGLSDGERESVLRRVHRKYLQKQIALGLEK